MTEKEFAQLVRENICGDGYDAEERAGEIIKAHNEIIMNGGEKLIQIKPKLYDHDHDDYFSKTAECGNCEEIIGSWSYGRKWCEGSETYFKSKHKYCPNCGRRIDWSE